MKNLIVLILLTTISIFFFIPKYEMMRNSEGKILNTNVEILYPKIKENFDEAELKFLPKVEKEDILGPDKDPAKCVCKGTGKIIHGDGHITDCPYHGKVKKEEPTPIKEVSYKKYNNSAKNIKHQIIIFSATWCAPCQVVKKTVLPELKKLGFVVSEDVSADFRVLDVDNNRQFYDSIRGNLNRIPMFIEIKNNVVVNREANALTLQQILNKYTEKQ